MNKINEIIEPFKIGERDFSPIEVINSMRKTIKCMSWGAHAWCIIDKTKGFRFAVNGHHHKGHVYIALAWNDTFRVYFTTIKGKIIDIIDNVYIDMLIDTIDRKVEYIPLYGNK